jgi:hypothetical protein
MKFLEKFKKQRQGAAEAARLQTETMGAAEEVDINQSCDAATKTETPASTTTTAGEEFARLEDEKSEFVLLLNK